MSGPFSARKTPTAAKDPVGRASPKALPAARGRAKAAIAKRLIHVIMETWNGIINGLRIHATGSQGILSEVEGQPPAGSVRV